LIEAYLYLYQHPSHRVLVIDFDQPLPELYQEYETQNYADYALGLILTAGDDYSIYRAVETSQSVSELPQGLQTLQHILLDTQRWTIAGKHQAWSWVNNVKTGTQE
jgi:hypothetical protein